MLKSPMTAIHGDPTYSTAQVARLVDRSEQWVRMVSARDGIGRMEGKGRRYTKDDLGYLRWFVNPDERRGRPRQIPLDAERPSPLS